MRAISEGVDDRLLSRIGELNQVGVAAHAGDDRVDVAVEDAGGIADALPAAELDVLLAQGGGRASEPCDPHLERYPRAVGGLLKQHRDVLPLERAFGPSPRLDRMGKLEHRPQLGRSEIGDVEEVPSVETHLPSHCSDHDAPREPPRACN